MAVKGVRAHLRDTTAGRSSFGSIAASGASKGAHTHMICSSSDSSISSSDEYALSSEWAMSRVARALARARVLMERGFVSRRVARFEAAQASLCARDGRPVTRVWCDGVVCRAVVCVGRRVRSRACRQLRNWRS